MQTSGESFDLVVLSSEGRPVAAADLAGAMVVDLDYLPTFAELGVSSSCDPAFIPHGGLVDEDLRPKEAYHRLRGLIESWQ